MKLFDLIENINIKETNVGNNNFEICNITRNSSDVKINSAFICLTGTKTDGHIYINEAIKNGAVLIILEYKPDDFEKTVIKSNTPYIIVENTRKTEAEFWMKWYGEPIKSGNIKIIGITGTNGKTSISFMVKQILEDAGYKTALFGTIKYIIGDIVEESKLTTSDSDELARLFSLAKDAKVDYVVMEILSHSLALNKVAGLGIIDMGIFTNLTQDHLDFHGNMKNYKTAKAKLFAMCKTGILNADDEATYDIINLSASKNYLYGIKSKVDFWADNIKYLGVDGIEYNFIAQNITEQSSVHKTIKISSPMAGNFYVYNTLAAAAAGHVLEIDVETISGALKKVKIKGRMEKLETDTPYSIFIDYAHTPDALENVLKSIRNFSKGKIITTFGCGGNRDVSKRPLMGKIASENSDFCVITSDNPRTENPEKIISDIISDVAGEQFEIIVDRREAIEYAMNIAQPDDIILLAGKGHEDYINEGGLIRHFSETEIVFEILKNKK
jgi:UDP-N-acetylmuramoyl-L-alanyl-D-glutamate--2,6-diaminopimelate ligase